MKKNGQLNLVFAAAFAAFLAGCPGPVHMDADTGPIADGGMPDNDAYVPPGDAGMDHDAYVDPGSDAGMDADGGMPPGSCTPDQIAAGMSGCVSCYCAMDSFMTEACASRPDECRTGLGMRNTCGMTAGTNRCGFALPLDGSGNMLAYAGGFSMQCARTFGHSTWSTMGGSSFDTDVMVLNGQTIMRWNGGPWGPQFTCEHDATGDVCHSNSSNSDLADEQYVELRAASDCLSAHITVNTVGASVPMEYDIFFVALR